MGSYKDLLVYKKSFEPAMKRFAFTKGFPQEQTYSLTDQIRRSLRPTTIFTIEAYRKRSYPCHLVSKLTDAGMEDGETQDRADFSLACGEYMIDNPGKFGAKQQTVHCANCQLKTAN